MKCYKTKSQLLGLATLGLPSPPSPAPVPTRGSQPSPRPAPHLSATQRAPSCQAEVLSLGGVRRRCAVPRPERPGSFCGMGGWTDGLRSCWVVLGPGWAPTRLPTNLQLEKQRYLPASCLPGVCGGHRDRGVRWLGALQAPNPPTSFLKGGLLITVNHKGVQTLECQGPRGVIWTCPILPDSPGPCPHIRERPRPEPGPQLPFWPNLGPGEICPAAGGGTQKGL